jgi:hypothetical protein|tara:strand:- start:143 stop:319 length:177 start_codon:yes stop_codon:yes gene_type:complete
MASGQFDVVKALSASSASGRSLPAVTGRCGKKADIMLFIEHLQASDRINQIPTIILVV